MFKGLVKAIRKESKLAVRHWWGAGHSAVSKWRVALDVPLSNEGTSQLRTEYSQEEWAVEARKKAWSKARDPERCAKIAASKRGKKRPAGLMEALRQANIGRKASAETRAEDERSCETAGSDSTVGGGEVVGLRKRMNSFER